MNIELRQIISDVLDFSLDASSSVSPVSIEGLPNNTLVSVKEQGNRQEIHFDFGSQPIQIICPFDSWIVPSQNLDDTVGENTIYLKPWINISIPILITFEDYSFEFIEFRVKEAQDFVINPTVPRNISTGELIAETTEFIIAFLKVDPNQDLHFRNPGLILRFLAGESEGLYSFYKFALLKDRISYLSVQSFFDVIDEARNINIDLSTEYALRRIISDEFRLLVSQYGNIEEWTESTLKLKYEQYSSSRYERSDSVRHEKYDLIRHSNTLDEIRENWQNIVDNSNHGEAFFECGAPELYCFICNADDHEFDIIDLRTNSYRFSDVLRGVSGNLGNQYVAIINSPLFSEWSCDERADKWRHGKAIVGSKILARYAGMKLGGPVGWKGIPEGNLYLRERGHISPNGNDQCPYKLKLPAKRYWFGQKQSGEILFGEVQIPNGIDLAVGCENLIAYIFIDPSNSSASIIRDVETDHFRDNLRLGIPILSRLRKGGKEYLCFMVRDDIWSYWDLDFQTSPIHLDQMLDLLLAMGATHAMGMDGGGSVGLIVSSTMIIQPDAHKDYLAPLAMAIRRKI